MTPPPPSVSLTEALRQRDAACPHSGRVLTSSAAEMCNGKFGVDRQNCSRCVNAKKRCAVVEPALYDAWRAHLAARGALRKALDNDDAALADRLGPEAKETAELLIAKLKRYDRSRHKTVGDTPVPSRDSTAAPTGLGAGGVSGVAVGELQSIRRGILALVEVQKAVSTFRSGHTPQTLVSSQLTAYAARSRRRCTGAGAFPRGRHPRARWPSAP